MSRETVIRGWVAVAAPIVTLVASGAAFYVTAKAEDKANEVMAPLERRVVELERNEATIKAFLEDVKANLRDIKDDQRTTREDVKEILRHQRTGK